MSVGKFYLINIFLFFLLFVSFIQGKQEDFYKRWYFSAGWNCARKVVLLASPTQDRNIAMVKFSAGGMIKEDGGDLRVVNDVGYEMSYRIVCLEPFGISYILFKIPDNRRNYFLFFGNEVATTGKLLDEHQTQCGLFLETYSCDDSPIYDLEDLRLLLSKKLPLLGVVSKKTIFDPFNELAIGQPHLRIYRGFILSKQLNTYSFALSTDGASFLFIDDKVVAQKTGKGGATSEPKYKGDVALLPGIHSLVFYHKSPSWPQKAVLCVRTQEKGSYTVIPSDMFFMPIETKVGSLEKRDRDWSADFEVSQVYTFEFFGNWLTLAIFSAPYRDLHQYFWDFGDGSIAEMNEVKHLFLSNKKYKITLKEVDDRGFEDKYTLELNFPLAPAIKSWTDKEINDIYEIVKNYPVNFMDVDSLWGLINISKFAGKKMKTIEACKIMKLKFPNYDKEKLYQAYTFLADALRSQEIKKYQESLETYKEMLDKWSNDPRSDQIKLNLGKMYLKTKQYDLAIKTFKEILDKHNWEVQDKVSRSAWVGLGDSYLEKGEIENARNEYYKILSKDGLSYEKIMILSGDYVTKIEGYLANDNLESVEYVLDEWGEKVPLDKLDGIYYLYQGKYLLKKKDYEEVIDRLNISLKVAEDDEIKSEALFLTGQAYIQNGKLDDAVKVFNELVETYPESSFCRDASDWMKTYKK